MTIINAVSNYCPAPDWLRELAAVQDVYVERLGWPASLEVGRRRLVLLIGEVLDAIAMPALLGALVASELRLMMLAGPIVADDSTQSWTFLTQAAPAPTATVLAELDRAHVCPVQHGTHAALPTSLVPDDNGQCRWISGPHMRDELPPFSVVVGTTRRILLREAAADGLTWTTTAVGQHIPNSTPTTSGKAA